MIQPAGANGAHLDWCQAVDMKKEVGLVGRQNDLVSESINSRYGEVTSLVLAVFHCHGHVHFGSCSSKVTSQRTCTHMHA